MTPNRDGATGIQPVELITPGVYGADQASGLIDLLDSQSATILIHVGVGGIAFSGANRIDFVLTAGDAADGSDQAPVNDIEVVKDAFCPAAIANGIVRSLIAAHPAADIQKVGYIGGHRFVKVVADFSGAHANGTPIAVTVIRSKLALKGVA